MNKHHTFILNEEKLKKNKVEYHNRFSIEYIVNYCEEHHILYEWTEDENIIIPWCKFGNNFYDYDEKPKPMIVTHHAFLTKSPLVKIIDCSECCGCAGW